MPAARRTRRCAVFAMLVLGGAMGDAAAADAFPTAPGTIWTIAGDGTACQPASGTCGDGPNALAAQLSTVRGLALDGAGNLYLGDRNAGKIRKLTPGGAISTIAGHDFVGCSTPTCGDGPDALAAVVDSAGLAADAAGNVYVADQQNNRVRKITPAGAISTIAGSGTQCATPTSSCGDGPNALTAQISSPGGVAVDGIGNVYVADQFASKVRKVTPAGAISTIAGTGTACGTPTGSCGDGPNALTAALSFPFGVAADDAGNVYVADSGDNKIRRITPAGAISTLAGDGTACADALTACGDGAGPTAAQLSSPRSLAVDGAHRVYVADATNRVRRFGPSGPIVTVAGTGLACAWSGCGDGGSGTLAPLSIPFGLAVDASGANVYISAAGDHLVRWLVGPQGGPVGPVGLAGVGSTGGEGPGGAPGSDGAAGKTGPTGKTGKAGRDARVTCKVGKAKKGKVRVVCTTKLAKKSSARVRLTRGGRVYATGTLATRHGLGVLSLHSTRRVMPGVYTLTAPGRAGSVTTRQEIRLG